MSASMNIKVKTLFNEEQTIEVDPSTKVTEVKASICAAFGKFEPTGLKVIHSGKVMDDDKTVGDYNVQGSDFFVVMEFKKPAAATPAPAATTPAPAAAEATPAADPPASTDPPAGDAGADNGSGGNDGGNDASDMDASATPPTADLGGDFASGDAYEAQVAELCDMGFPRDQVEAAMRAAFNNANRAVDYLFNGIPDNVVPPAGAGGAAAMTGVTGGAAAGGGNGGAAPAADVPQTGAFNMFGGNPAAAAAGGGGGGGGGGGDGDDPLGPLRNLPQFAMIRAMVQTQPDLLEPLLARLQQENPELVNLINQNQQAFIDMINEPLQPHELQQLQAMLQAQGMGGAMGGGGGGGGGQGVIQVTAEEKAAIERLQELGFPHHLVVEAFIVCDRDEQRAAAYLFDNADAFQADYDDAAGGNGGDAGGN